MIALGEYSGKKVRITLKNGLVFEGVGYDYTSELDNEPYGACISIDNVEILESEISKVDVVD